jgi:simple sugar transport system substrate-binding protein
MLKRAKLLLFVVLVVAFTFGATAGNLWAQEERTFYLVSFCGPGDPFWLTVIRGMDDAAKRYGVKATYVGPEVCNVKDQVNILLSTIARKPDGIGLAIGNPVPLDEAARKAIGMGIPIVAFNVADTRPEDERIPYLTYVGQTPYAAGKAVGKRALKEFTPKRVVVNNHIPGHTALAARARGIIDVMKENGIPAEELNVGTDNTQAVQIMKSYYAKHPDTDLFSALGPIPTHAQMVFLEEENLLGKVKQTAFDLDPKILDGIKNGQIIATVDQQPYLEGYLTVMWLYLNVEYGLMPDPQEATGPTIVDISNIESVVKGIEGGYR